MLLLGWLALIASLPSPAGIPRHGPGGNQLFWVPVVPSGLLILVAGSHELWRRICPWPLSPSCSGPSTATRLSGRPRGSTVTAREPVRALVFNASGFEQLPH